MTESHSVNPKFGQYGSYKIAARIIDPKISLLVQVRDT